MARCRGVVGCDWEKKGRMMVVDGGEGSGIAFVRIVIKQSCQSLMG